MTSKISTIILSAVVAFCFMFQSANAQGKKDYNLVSPQGWETENEVAAQQGLQFAFIPEGKNWENTDALIFANQAELKANESIFDFIDDDILFYAASVNDLKVKRAKVIEIGEGHNLAVVKHMISETDGVYEAYAYIPEDGKVNFITLRADSEEAFNKNLDSFKDLVSSYRLQASDAGMMADSE
jgi:hypothetical protein